MNGDEPTPQSFSWMRRWSAALNLIITVSAVVALVAMCNYLAIRHFTRFHWNRDIEGELSPRTHSVLKSLTNTVKVIVYFDSEDPLFSRIKGLLKEYEIATPRVQVQFVDYLRDNAAARKVKLDYQLTSVNDRNVIIFDVTDRRPVVVNAGELSDYDTSGLISGKTNAVYRTHFKGELLFTSKIFGVANARSPVAYYLLGNGEHPPGSVDSPESYGKFLAMLRNENNFDLRPLLLTGTNEVPAACNLLVVAGPTQPLDKSELDKIQSYLEQGGRMLVAFNNATVNGRPTGLERLLAKWGVDVGNNWVVDRDNSMNGEILLASPIDLGRHQIVNALQNSRVLLYKPRSISARPASRGDETRVDELLFTGPDTIVFTDSREPDRTQKGPKPLMAAVEKSVPALQRGSTRLVVLGDSTIWANQFIDLAANREFAALAANWLVNQSVLLGEIPRRAIHTYKLTMTRAQLRSVQLILLAGMPGVVLLIGLLVWVRRRH